MNKTLVVVPTYNERENLLPLAQRLLALPVPVDLLVVDDNSPDGTGKLADELAAKHPAIHVLHRTEKSGLGRAYIAGFKWALERGYEFVFEMDGDFSHNPDDIPMFLEAARNADLVLGSRYLNGIRIINWPLSRLMLSKSAAKYVQLITGMPITDPTGGYKCFTPAGAAGHQPGGDQLQRLQLPDRDDPPALAAGHEDRGGADRLHRAGSRPFQDVRAHHPGSLDHGLAALVPEQDAPPSRRAPHELTPARSIQDRTVRPAQRAGTRIVKTPAAIGEAIGVMPLPTRRLVQPFADAVLRSAGLRVATPEYNGSVRAAAEDQAPRLIRMDDIDARCVGGIFAGSGIAGQVCEDH